MASSLKEHQVTIKLLEDVHSVEQIKNSSLIQKRKPGTAKYVDVMEDIKNFLGRWFNIAKKVLMDP